MYNGEGMSDIFSVKSWLIMILHVFRMEKNNVFHYNLAKFPKEV